MSGKIKRLHSLRYQIALSFIGIIAISLLAIGLINGFFLESVYVRNKTNALIDTFDNLGTFNADSEEVPDNVRKSSSENNLTWVVTTFEGNIVCGGGTDNNSVKQLASRLFGYLNDFEQTDPEVVKSTDQYTIQKNKDHFVGMDYLEMYGELSNGNYCIIRSPLESIRESVSISNMFYICIGIVVIVISTIAIWIMTKQLTRPISELIEISQCMASLDFDTRYESRGRNEIDALGENFNRMSDELEHTISELKSANIELKQDIDNKIEIDNRRKEFLDNVSHELKTPIALIQGYAEGLKENITDDPESMDFYCDVIMDESAKMNIMVKKLLTLNQLEAGDDPVTMDRFDIVELIRGIIQSSNILVQQKEAKVLFSQKEPIHVWADEFKIEEVVTNYFTNALNHLDDHKTIEIKTITDNGKVRVSVFNTGEPIPSQDIDHVWDKFYKVDKARTREYGGSGIGLSIVKAIMDSMNQECGACNFDNGVEFWFTLDLK